MKLLALLFVVMMSVFGQARKSQTIFFFFAVQNERTVPYESHRLAAQDLFKGFEQTTRTVFTREFKGLFIGRQYVVTSILLARSKSVREPQTVAVTLRDVEANTTPEEVYRFRLSLETDFETEAEAVVKKLMEKIKPMPLVPGRTADNKGDARRASPFHLFRIYSTIFCTRPTSPPSSRTLIPCG